MKPFLFYNLAAVFILFVLAGFKSVQSADTGKNSLVIVLVNTASWCPLCQKHGPRIRQEIINAFAKDTSYQIIINDLSTDSSRKASFPAAEAAGIGSFVTENRATGILYLIHAQNKKLLSKISVKMSTEKIKQALIDAKK